MAFKLSQKTINAVRQDVGSLQLETFRKNVGTSGSTPNPLHYAVLGAIPPEIFQREIKKHLGDIPALDGFIEEPLETFPSEVFHDNIAVNFIEIDNLESIKILALGRKPLEILSAIRKYTGQVLFINSEYFTGLDLSNSPKLEKLLA